MDTSSTLLGISLLLVFIAPVGYLIINQSRQEKVGKKTLLTAAARENLEISQFVILNGFLLGLDERQGKLIFLSSTRKNKPEVIAIKGSKVQLLKKYHNGSNEASIDELREVSLKILCRDRETVINFYRSDADPVTETYMRLQKALEWENILNSFPK